MSDSRVASPPCKKLRTISNAEDSGITTQVNEGPFAALCLTVCNLSNLMDPNKWMILSLLNLPPCAQYLFLVFERSLQILHIYRAVHRYCTNK